MPNGAEELSDVAYIKSHSGPYINRPRILVLFCGGGGCSMGFYRAGFDVVGVDIIPQPDYPFEFHQADAMTYPLAGFDAFHGGPPCQGYSSLTHLGKTAGDGVPLLIGSVRERLEATGLPYVIENVERARWDMTNPYRLCGSSFGLGVRRHRLFETNFPIMVPPCDHARQGPSIGVYGDHPQSSSGRWRNNRAHTLEQAQEAMGIDWLGWNELKEAIPPAYTEHIGRQLIEQLRVAA